MGNEIDHIETRHALLVQVIDGMRVFFAKNSHQHVSAGHFLFAAAGGLHMHDGALNDALETQRGLGIDVFGTGDLRRVVLDEGQQRLAQVINIGRAGAQHLGGAGVVQQGQQQMFHRDEFMALLTRLDKRHVEADFQFLGNHGIPLRLLFQALTVI